MKRIIGAVVLILFSFALLLGFSGEPEQSDYAHYFRDNTGYAATDVLICYAEAPCTEYRGFEEDYLIAQGALPELDGFNNFNGCGLYYEDGSIYELSCYWQNFEEDDPGGSYKQLSLSITPAGEENLLARDGAVVPDETGNTETTVNGILVTGVGTAEKQAVGDRMLRNNCLIFEKDGMRYQIGATHQTSLEEMGAVLDFYLEHDLDISVFTMERGDTYEYRSLSEYPDAFPGCIPDESALPLTRAAASLSLKNGAYDSAYMDFEYTGDSGETLARIFITVDIPTEDTSLPQLRDLTAEDILASLQNEREIDFLVDAYRLDVSINDPEYAHMLLSLLATLPDFPAAEPEHTPEYYFRDNTGQQGTFLLHCRNGSELHQERCFLDRWAEMLEAGVFPALPGAALSYLNGYYYPEEELCLVSMGFGDVMVYIYPPDAVIWDSYYDVSPEDCTQTEVNGITIYADGLADGNEKAFYFTLPDGSTVYIVATDGADASVMTALAEHFAKNGLDFAAFSMDRGDHYEYVGLEDTRAAKFLSGLYPETDSMGHVSVEIKNDVILRAVISYEVHPGRSITWTVYPEFPIDVALSLRDLPYITEQELQEWMNEAGATACTYLDGKYIKISVSRDNLADELWELIQPMQ